MIEPPNPLTLDVLYDARRNGWRPPIVYIVLAGNEPPPSLPWILFRAGMERLPHFIALGGLRVRIWDRGLDLAVHRFTGALRKLPRTLVSVCSEDLNGHK